MKRTNWCLPLLLAASPAAGATGAPGLQEIPDRELGDMRGRYVVGDDLVAWFGVTMTSVWRTASGQTLEGALQVGLDLSVPGAPALSFRPSVSITAADAASPPEGNGGRVDGAGLANVDGLVQSVQIAGDGNRTRNATVLRIHDGGAPPAAAPSADGPAVATAPGMRASAGVAGGIAGVLLQVDGLGASGQWLRPGSAGQSIRLTADGQWIQNRLQLDLIRHDLPGTANLRQHVAQAIGMNRGSGGP